jgi:hypothetical protein
MEIAQPKCQRLVRVHILSDQRAAEIGRQVDVVDERRDGGTVGLIWGGIGEEAQDRLTGVPRFALAVLPTLSQDFLKAAHFIRPTETRI